MDEFEELKPLKNNSDFNRWNLNDLEKYVKNLKEEILKIEKVINSKKNLSDQALDLFKK